MRTTFFVLLLFTLVSSFGHCGKKKKQAASKAISTQKIVVLNNNQVWMRYDETKCSNPWQFNWLVKPTDEQLAGAVKGELEGRSVHVLEIRTERDNNVVNCEACTCQNGFHYFVLVNKSSMTALKALKFYEVKEVPERSEINTR